MQFIGKPKPLLPLMNTKDCSLRLCTPLCPQWCDAIFPPPSPPPPLAAFPDDKPHSSPTFSPLVIAIIGILASAFLLVSYYAIISKYCGRNNSNSSSSSRIGRETRPPNHEDIFDEGYDGASNIIEQHEPWLINTPGLDEALIKSITLVKFKKSDGLISCADCSVCLGEFLEDDTLRLLPKCSHAFHVACIDTWLRSHSNCPLCRANIVSSFSQPPTNTNYNYNPPLVVDDNNSNNNDNNVQDHNTLLENQVANEEMISSSGEERQVNIVYEPKTPSRALSDLSARGHGGRNSITRSISMDHRYDAHLSIPDVFRCNLIQEEDCTVKTCQFHDQSLKTAAGESSKYGVCTSSSSSSSGGTRNGVLHCVMSSVAMKRSFSSGRILFSKCGRGKNAVIIPP